MRDEMAIWPTGAALDGGHRSEPSGDDRPALPSVSLLALQFLAWVATAPRTHADVMDAWRSTCPRQSVWEDTLIDGLVEFEAGTRNVVLTALGRLVLATGHHG